jgi:hypothetical protein
MACAPFGGVGRLLAEHPRPGARPTAMMLFFYPDPHMFSRIPEGPSRGYPVAVRVEISEEAVEVLLSRWEKVLGLLGDIRVPRADVGEVEVMGEPMRAVMATGLKAGLRLPWFYYVARTIRLDEAWLVRRGVPALSFSVRDKGALRRVVVCTPEAVELARRLTSW